MLPEVFECPDCERQFVLDLVEGAVDCSIHCPQCGRYLGEKDVHFVLRNEIEELTARLRFERDRLEKDEAVYTGADAELELATYGREVHKIIAILDDAVRRLEALGGEYR